MSPSPPGVRHLFTRVDHGDLGRLADPNDLDQRRKAIVDAPWTWLEQVHGSEVVTVTRPGEHAGARADAAVTATAGAVLAVTVADCAPLLLVGDGAIAVVHAGWQGLMAGIVDAACDALADVGHPAHTAWCGPCIRGRCYEFGADGLSQFVDTFGPAVATKTSWGTPALDLVAGARTAAHRRGLAWRDEGTCTACSPVHWSHRARQDPQRQALVAWLEPES